MNADHMKSPIKFLKSKYKRQLLAIYRWISPFADPLRLVNAFPRYFWFFKDVAIYSKLDGAEPVRIIDTYPVLHDKTDFTGFDRHYFYQDSWSFKKIYQSKAVCHVDIGSNVVMVGLLTAVTKVVFVDIRPLVADLDNLILLGGSLLALPFADASIKSLSCLNVAEHVGLGRYGDPLNPLGTMKACKELSRVLAADGNLYFSLPVGKPRLMFNAHRIHAPQQIVEYFSDLELVEFSGIDNGGNFIRNVDPSVLECADFATGLFHFIRK